ncbi:MAG: HNH endonuclease signature motif containing protein [Chloroflexi bacterium]|nr:HNH endonuclease signature motif containing protein [Chloroflexota bacterium]
MFLARGGRPFDIMPLPSAPKRATPPQVKRRERRALQRHQREWHRQLAARYGERCANCGAADRLVLDHVMPIARGGRSQLDNLQLLCATCNRIKGALMIDCRSFIHPE